MKEEEIDGKEMGTNDERNRKKTNEADKKSK